ncbi:MAG: AAC(3) family N-acetyltransferase [Candidatus Polarisedimenticolaceae bacterium]|nr:AAC(3) family N-acetyltransferase [Candidatus Polarisedimenticolaceae bacterium]
MNARLLKRSRQKIKSFVIHRFLSFDAGEFQGCLRKLGIGSGDIVMVHASWNSSNGFKGRPAEMIQAIKQVLGPSGLLSMPSLTYQNQSSSEFLAEGKSMNVRRSPSRMGLLSEVFRRNQDVVRSLSPTHPILAWGERAEEFVAGHEQVKKPFGEDTPFSRLLEWKGKILTIDAPFSTITFCHYLEDRIAACLPFDLYEPEPVTGVVVDYEGRQIEVPTQVLSKTANRLRRDDWLEEEMRRQGVLHYRKIGNTRLMLVDTIAMTEVVDKMYAEGRSFFAVP